MKSIIEREATFKQNVLVNVNVQPFTETYNVVA